MRRRVREREGGERGERGEWLERRRVFRLVKEGVGYVARDLEGEMERCRGGEREGGEERFTTFTLPDGKCIKIEEKERFLGSELYFYPRSSPFHSPFSSPFPSPLPLSLTTDNFFNPSSSSSPSSLPGLHHLTYQALSHYHTTNTTNTTKTYVTLSGGRISSSSFS